MRDMNPVLRLCHAAALQQDLCPDVWRGLARDALAEYDRQLVRVSELEKELAVAKKALLYPMTDLA